MRSEKGLTLIELLVVMIIVGILAGVAVPIYTNYMQRARRADAKTALEQLRAAQEMRRAERGSYETSLTALQNSWGVPTNASLSDYNLSFIVATANSFTAEATPKTKRQVGDGWLRINHLGQKWDSKGEYYPSGKWAK